MKNILASSVLFALLPSGVFASVVINEIAWMGTGVDGVEPKNWWRYEWLELYNNANNPASLDGWKIELYRTGLDWSLELSGTVPAQSYFLIVASDKISSSYDLNYSNLGGKFVNGGQRVFLKDGSGNTVDVVDALSGWPAGDNGTKQTMERIDSGWQTSQNPGGTPKAPNSSEAGAPANDSQPTTDNSQPTTNNEQPTTDNELPAAGNLQLTTNSQASYPDGILINELLPSPDGPDEEQEWIEIFNQNGFAVELSGWQVQDTIGSLKKYTFPEGTSIGAGGFLALLRPTTDITLNNSGDGVRLLKPNNDIADEVAFGKAPTAQSYNRPSTQLGTDAPDEWVWSEVLTPGSANIIPAPKTTKEQTTAATGDTESAETEDPQQQLAALMNAPKDQKSQSSFPLALLIAPVPAVLAGAVVLLLKKKLAVQTGKN